MLIAHIEEFDDSTDNFLDLPSMWNSGVDCKILDYCITLFDKLLMVKVIKFINNYFKDG